LRWLDVCCSCCCSSCSKGATTLNTLQTSNTKSSYHSLSAILSLSLTHTHTLSLSLSLYYPLSLSHTHYLFLSHHSRHTNTSHKWFLGPLTTPSSHHHHSLQFPIQTLTDRTKICFNFNLLLSLSVSEEGKIFFDWIFKNCFPLFSQRKKIIGRFCLWLNLRNLWPTFLAHPVTSTYLKCLSTIQQHFMWRSPTHSSRSWVTILCPIFFWKSLLTFFKCPNIKILHLKRKLILNQICLILYTKLNFFIQNWFR